MVVLFKILAFKDLIEFRVNAFFNTTQLIFKGGMFSIGVIKA